MTDSAQDIRRRADLARRLARTAHDKGAAASLEDLAAELTHRARELEAEAVQLPIRAEIAQQHALEANRTAAKILEQVEAAKRKKATRDPGHCK